MTLNEYTVRRINHVIEESGIGVSDEVEFATDTVIGRIKKKLRKKCEEPFSFTIDFCGRQIGLQKFISQFKGMIAELVQSIKNEILDWFIDQLNILIKDIAAQLAVTLVAEQYEYYVNLFNRCVKCLRLHGSEYDWNMDDVDYADITGMTEYSRAPEHCQKGQLEGVSFRLPVHTRGVLKSDVADLHVEDTVQALCASAELRLRDGLHTVRDAVD